MRVLMLTAMYPTPDNPGYGSYVRTQVESLQRAGVDIELMVLQGRNRKLMYPAGAWHLRRRLADTPVDLVHAHYSLTGMVARTQWRVPVVVTYHGSDVLGSTDVHGHYSLMGRATVAAGLMLGRMVDAIIVQSQQMAQKFARNDVNIIPHEVDLDLFRPTPRDEARRMLGLDPDRKYLLFAARPTVPVKRYPFAAAVTDRLAREDPSVELVVVYKEPQARLALYMSAADALVFPSIHEGSPNIVKQALACNLPIVSTDVGDVREMVGDTQHCFILDADQDTWTDALRGILRERPRIDGRQRVTHLDPASVSAQVIAVYDGVLARRRSISASGRTTAERKPRDS